MPTYRLDLEYCGSAYRGWQAQKNADTVANRVEAACRDAFGQVQELQAAGRTDSGVHALQQVCHLRAPARPEGASLLHRINDRLPQDIALRSLRRMPDPFHARHDAIERVYAYQILRCRSAFGPWAWWVKDKLDPKAMVQAALVLQGTHDFTSFCEKDPGKPVSPKLELRSVELSEHGPVILIRFRARHFLWKMVRRLTGAMVEVGRGHARAADLSASLKKPDARWAPHTAPPHGLFLERVLYPGERWEAPPNPLLNLP